MSGRSLRWQLLVFLAVVAVAGVALGLRGGGGPPRVTEVPATLPAGGVDVGGQVVLKPLAHLPAHAISKAAAVGAARRYSKSRSYRAAVLEASVTAGDSARGALHGAPAWVVTFTSPRPQAVSTSGRKRLVKHLSVVLDPVSGKVLLAFFTK